MRVITFFSSYKRQWGKVYELLDLKGKFTIAVEIIPPGGKINKHYHKKAKEIEIVLDGNPLVNNSPSNPGNYYYWQCNAIHEYDNSDKKKKAIILTISLPNFDINDEIFI